jgi:hypothetical protein
MSNFRERDELNWLTFRYLLFEEKLIFSPWNYLEIFASVLYFSRVHLHNWNTPSAYTEMF